MQLTFAKRIRFVRNQLQVLLHAPTIWKTLISDITAGIGIVIRVGAAYSRYQLGFLKHLITSTDDYQPRPHRGVTEQQSAG
jgi:hypothetical protein